MESNPEHWVIVGKIKFSLLGGVEKGILDLKLQHQLYYHHISQPVDESGQPVDEEFRDEIISVTLTGHLI